MEIFSEIGPRKNFLVPQIRRQVSAHGGRHKWMAPYFNFTTIIRKSKECPRQMETQFLQMQPMYDLTRPTFY